MSFFPLFRLPGHRGSCRAALPGEERHLPATGVACDPLAAGDFDFFHFFHFLPAGPFLKPTLAPLSRPQLARRASLGPIPRRPLSASPRPFRRALGRPAATFLGRATSEETPGRPQNRPTFETRSGLKGPGPAAGPLAGPARPALPSGRPRGLRRPPATPPGDLHHLAHRGVPGTRS